MLRLSALRFSGLLQKVEMFCVFPSLFPDYVKWVSSKLYTLICCLLSALFQHEHWNTHPVSTWALWFIHKGLELDYYNRLAEQILFICMRVRINALRPSWFYLLLWPHCVWLKICMSSLLAVTLSALVYSTNLMW